MNLLIEVFVFLAVGNSQYVHSLQDFSLGFHGDAELSQIHRIGWSNICVFPLGWCVYSVMDGTAASTSFLALLPDSLGNGSGAFVPILVLSWKVTELNLRASQESRAYVV